MCAIIHVIRHSFDSVLHIFELHLKLVEKKSVTHTVKHPPPHSSVIQAVLGNHKYISDINNKIAQVKLESCC